MDVRVSLWTIKAFYSFKERELWKVQKNKWIKVVKLSIKRIYTKIIKNVLIWMILKQKYDLYDLDLFSTIKKCWNYLTLERTVEYWNAIHCTDVLCALMVLIGDFSILKSYWYIFPREDPIAKVAPSGMKSTAVRGASATKVFTSLWKGQQSIYRYVDVCI